MEAAGALLKQVDFYRGQINELLKENDRASLVLKTSTATFVVCYLYDWIYNDDKSVSFRVRRDFFRFLRTLPVIGPKIMNEVLKAKKGIQESKDLYHESYLTKLPEKGSSVEDMKELIENYMKLDVVEWRKGRVQGAVYDYDPEIIEVSTKAYEMFMWTNPLHADVFRGPRKMEAEVISMILRLYNGPKGACGLFTSGGTESIGLAVLAARNTAMAKGIKWPEVVMPVTAHPAFDKACDYFRVKMIKIPVNKETMQVEVTKMRSAIGSRTCLLVGSAPNYPHGAYDDLPGINKLAMKYKIPFHVDACLGSFINAFAAEAGFPLPVFDFRLEGATSISCDTHKYGYSPKG